MRSYSITRAETPCDYDTARAQIMGQAEGPILPQSIKTLTVSTYHESVGRFSRGRQVLVDYIGRGAVASVSSPRPFHASTTGSAAVALEAVAKYREGVDTVSRYYPTADTAPPMDETQIVALAAADARRTVEVALAFSGAEIVAPVPVGAEAL